MKPNGEYKEMKNIFIIGLLMGLLGTVVGAQTSVRVKQPYFRKTVKAVPSTRVSVTKVKLYDPKDSSKSVDFHIENVDMPGMTIVKQELNDKYDTMLAVVKNKNVIESKTAYLAVTITEKVTKTDLDYKTGKPYTKTLSSKTIYEEGVVLPILKPGEELKHWFDLSKSGLSFKGGGGWLSIPTGNQGTLSYLVQCWLVTEPIEWK